MYSIDALGIKSRWRRQASKKNIIRLLSKRHVRSRGLRRFRFSHVFTPVFCSLWNKSTFRRHKTSWSTFELYDFCRSDRYIKTRYNMHLLHRIYTQLKTLLFNWKINFIMNAFTLCLITINPDKNFFSDRHTTYVKHLNCLLICLY